MKLNTILVIALLLTVLGAVVLSLQAANPDGPPANPAEFHKQEMARIARGIQAEQQMAITSTQSDYDVTFYDLAVDARGYYSHTMAGSVNIIARSVASDLDSMVLDFCANMAIDSVYANFIPATYSRNTVAGQMTVALDRTYGVGETVNVRVVWHGHRAERRHLGGSEQGVRRVRCPGGVRRGGAGGLRSRITS